MKPGETVRYACGECLVAFDVQLAPTKEWAEGGVGVSKDVELPPTSCPFCGSGDIKVKLRVTR
jgi:hypothetical protein